MQVSKDPDVNVVLEALQDFYRYLRPGDAVMLSQKAVTDPPTRHTDPIMVVVLEPLDQNSQTRGVLLEYRMSPSTMPYRFRAFPHSLSPILH